MITSTELFKMANKTDFSELSEFWNSDLLSVNTLDSDRKNKFSFIIRNWLKNRFRKEQKSCSVKTKQTNLWRVNRFSEIFYFFRGRLLSLFRKSFLNKKKILSSEQKIKTCFLRRKRSLNREKISYSELLLWTRKIIIKNSKIVYENSKQKNS